jgi:5-methyltetrahydropteroyltriglutamate--homocysteine methyltransferase
MRGDVWTIETKDRNFGDIELFGAYRGKLPKKICIGAVSHRVLQADRPEDVANAIRTALKHIAPEQLIVSSDCGFGRQGFNRTVAFYKATGIAQGRNIVLKELGLEERYVAAADPALQTDVLPDREPLTHLPSPWK